MVVVVDGGGMVVKGSEGVVGCALDRGRRPSRYEGYAGDVGKGAMRERSARFCWQLSRLRRTWVGERRDGVKPSPGARAGASDRFGGEQVLRRQGGAGSGVLPYRMLRGGCRRQSQCGRR